MITLLFTLYSFVIIASFLLDFLPQYKNTPVGLKINLMADYTLGPIRKLLPPETPFDASHIIVLLLLVAGKILFSFIIIAYTFIIIADVILSFLPQYRYENWAIIVKKLADFALDPVRRILPADVPFDFSPMIVIIILQLLTALN